MLNIKAFPFNPFAMNTHVLWDETHEGVIIDAGNYTNEENIILLDFIKANSIKIMSLWFTHNHIDHIIGAKFLCEEYSVIAKSHTKGKFLFEQKIKMNHNVFLLLTSIDLFYNFSKHNQYLLQ